MVTLNVAEQGCKDLEASFLGCFFGLSFGDALCAPYEGGVLERLVWRLIGTTLKGKRRFTDDTQMSLDVAESYLECGQVDQSHLANVFAQHYRWSRGYGPGAAKMLKKIRRGAAWQSVNCSVFPQGSFGNGAAMRAPIVAMCCYGQADTLSDSITHVSEITHAHPLAIEGALLVATVTTAALESVNPDKWLDRLQVVSQLPQYQAKLKIAQQWLVAGERVSPKIVVAQLGNGIAASESCVTAIYLAVRFLNEPYLTLLDFIKRCGGDTDTIAAMSGAVWGACHGLDALRTLRLDEIESSVFIRSSAEALARSYHA